MKRSVIARLISEIYKFQEQRSVPQDVGKSLDNSLEHLLAMSPEHEYGQFVEPEVESEGIDTPPAKDKPAKRKFKDDLEEAFEILKNESKPGPTLLKNVMEVELKYAKKLYAKLKRDGWFDKEEDTTQKEESPSKSITELVSELPDGDDLLVAKHLQPLVALEFDARENYICKINIDDVVTADDIARATANGVDTTLVDEIQNLSGTNFKKVPAKQLLDLDHKDNAKYLAAKNKYASAIPQGDKLFEHMSRGGVNKRVLRDLRDISDAVKAGKV